MIFHDLFGTLLQWLTTFVVIFSSYFWLDETEMQPMSLVTHPDHVQLCNEFCCMLSVNKLDPFICSLLSYKKYSDFSKNPSCPILQTTHSFPTVVLASLANKMGSSPNGLCPTHREYCMLNNFWKWQKKPAGSSVSATQREKISAF